jgi:hypothetical protein
MNGTLATSTTVENGLNLSLNGTSRSGLNFSSQNSFTVSPTSVRRLENYIVEQKINSILQKIRHDILCRRKISKEMLSTLLNKQFSAKLPKTKLIEKVMEKIPSFLAFKEHVQAQMLQT